MLKMSKITKTYSIDQKIYETFNQITEQKNINKSSFIEKCINNYINENKSVEFGNMYKSKYDENYRVSISSEDNNFYYLSNGSRIEKNLFKMTFDLIK
jgi:metal-responsive CopG/Arc/MetJ family transcriptional regulator